MEINQFHSGTAVGDAITNQMLAIQELLAQEGYVSKIYAQFVADKLKGKIEDIIRYKGHEKNIMLVHHSMGFDGFERIVALPDKKALIYHNITPEVFFDDPHIKFYIRKGLHQAKDYRNYVKYALADSNYNRQSLISMGYTNVDVMPVQISVDRFDGVKSNGEFLQQNASTKNILFVGRLAPNKCQHDVIKAFAVYAHNFNAGSKLFLAGDDNGGYAGELKKLSQMHGIEDKVVFLGKVSEETLKACYEAADIFLSMSEHEGFGVPLLEAMKMGLPVVAYKASAIPETMGGAGVLVTEKDANFVGPLIHELLSDNDLYNAIVQKQYERIDKLKNTNTRKILLSAIENINKSTRPRQIQIQGPFETSYSLALVNRKLAQAMDDLDKDSVSIYCTEGNGDYLPKTSDLQALPHASRLWEKSKDITYPDVSIRNMYPPRVSDVNGGQNFQSFAWEEDRVPQNYINDFNRYLNGIGTTSDFVTNALINSGIKIPVKTIGNGVDLPANYNSLLPYKLKTTKGVKFLHISSAFPRKGVDILLEAYFMAFSSQDDVCLVLKTFPNIHNNVEEQIKSLKEQHNNPPEIELINEDIPSDKLYGLYKAADCYVHVARGEGFGLPVAEAMLCKIPVIVSPNTGLSDFCNKDTALLVDYEMEPAQTHLSTENSKWAKPNKNTLSDLLERFVHKRESLEVDKKTKNAHKLISSKYTWKAVAKRWYSFIDEVHALQHKPKVAMVTTWNNKCGIAEYTRLLCEELEQKVDFTIYPNSGVKLMKIDEPNVAGRLWHSAFEGDLKDLKEEIKKRFYDFLHFQFNFGFFKLDHLADLITDLYEHQKIIITFHKTKDATIANDIISLRSIKDQLNLCYRLIVHQTDDRDLLISMGIDKDSIDIIPLGQISYPEKSREFILSKINLNRSLIIGSYGFLLPNKGIKEAIEALALIKKQYPDVLYIISCALYESIDSLNYLDDCQKLADKLKLNKNVVFITEFLPNDESVALLQACDVLLMAYHPSGESASGAIRFCIAALRPVITTRQDIFNEFAGCTHQIDNCQANKIADVVLRVKNEPDLYESLVESMKKKISDTSWERAGNLTYNLYKN